MTIPPLARITKAVFDWMRDSRGRYAWSTTCDHPCDEALFDLLMEHLPKNRGAIAHPFPSGNTGKTLLTTFHRGWEGLEEGVRDVCFITVICDDGRVLRSGPF